MASYIVGKYLQAPINNYRKSTKIFHANIKNEITIPYLENIANKIVKK